MQIQIFGTKKCKDTAKAVRFFKERGGVKIHQIDILEKPISKGEFNNIFRSVSPEECINRDSQAFEKLQLKYIQFNPLDKLLEHPEITRTPIVRLEKNATVGFQPDVWKKWIGR
ncbi:MAG: ArsC family transcriptional regulator [Leptospiraceae bacterium]|nr:ArsC family transcriptional regulator [Leptospiraceae bacterium]